MKNTIRMKIRMQYFNLFIYAMIPLIPLAFILILIATWGNPDYPFSDVFKSIPISILSVGVLIWPWVLLSVLNRFFFGKVVCTLDKEGIRTEKQLIPWREIQSIRYIPDIAPGRVIRDWCRIRVVQKLQSGREIVTEIKHFPYYGYRAIRKMHPNINASYDRSDIWGYLAVATIGVLIVLICGVN